MKTFKLKMSIPKLAVLATGLTVAVLPATMTPQAAQVFPPADDLRREVRRGHWPLSVQRCRLHDSGLNHPSRSVRALVWLCFSQVPELPWWPVVVSRSDLASSDHDQHVGQEMNDQSTPL